MKKTFSSVLAILLALAMVGVFAACGGGGGTTTEAPTTEDLFTTEPPTEETTEPEITSDTEITDPDQPTTEAPTEPGATTDPNATDAPADKFAPPANLNTLGKAEQLAYFNLVANKVRDEKPGFSTEYLEKIEKISLSGAAAIANPIVEMVKNQLMPGEWKYETFAKGTDNKGKFLSEITPFELRSGDVASINSVKSGENWVMTVKIVSENNPAKPTGSANARAYPIASRQEVFDEITGISDLISADINNATLRYHSGYITLTVNPKGQVIAGEFQFQVDAKADNVKISIVTTNVTAPQSTTKKYKSFVW